MSKKIKKVLGYALPIAGGFLGSAVPGVGTALGSALGGAAGGALSGGGLKGALLGGVSSYAGNALSGASGLGSTGNIFSKGGSMAGGFLQGAGSGLGGGASLFSAGNLGKALSGVKSYMDQDEMEDQLMSQQKRSEVLLSPFTQAGLGATNQLSSRLQEGFTPDDLENDPGYKFNLAQGQKALDRSASARGSYYSGSALKEAQDYGQGLADNTYNSAYQRWASENGQIGNLAGQGQNAAGALTGVYDNQGNIGANATLGKSNVMSSTLSNILQGSGARTIVGHKADGTPIYADDQTSTQYGA